MRYFLSVVTRQCLWSVALLCIILNLWVVYNIFISCTVNVALCTHFSHWFFFETCVSLSVLDLDRATSSLESMTKT